MVMRMLILLMVFFLLAVQIQAEPHQRRAEEALDQDSWERMSGIRPYHLEGMKLLLFQIQMSEVGILETGAEKKCGAKL